MFPLFSIRDDAVVRKIAVFSFIIAAAIIVAAILAFFFIGDSAFVLKTSRHAVTVDPSSKISRDAAKSLGKIDAVLITHEHDDHFASEATLDLCRTSGCMIIVN